MEEGLGILYKIGGIALSLMGPGSPRFRYNAYKLAKELYQRRLECLNDHRVFLSAQDLMKSGLFKRKYPPYANYLAMFGSQALLSKLGIREVVAAMTAKTSMAIGTKVMDNINDEWQSPEEAYRSVGHLEVALKTGGVPRVFRPAGKNHWIQRAENSAIEMTAWTGRILQTFKESSAFSYSLYEDDVVRWITGQQASLVHKSRPVNLKEYLLRVLEKSTGSLWADPDLIILESGLHGFDGEFREKALSIRAHGDLLIKSCLLYDDVVDLYNDLRTNSVNALLIRGMEQGTIDLDTMREKRPKEVYALLCNEGVVDEVLRIGDLLFETAMRSLDIIPYDDSVFDRKGLEFCGRLLRLFNLRKLVIRDRTLRSLKVCLSSLTSLPTDGHEASNESRQLVNEALRMSSYPKSIEMSISTLVKATS